MLQMKFDHITIDHQVSEIFMLENVYGRTHRRTDAGLTGILQAHNEPSAQVS